MKYIKPTKKLISVVSLLGIILTGAYFVLGNTGKSGPEAALNLEEHGLVGHWNFEEGSGQTISDRSGNGNDGTLGANDSVGKDDPVFVAGHDSSGPGGTGMSFDGVDDYVDLPNGDTYLNVDAGTISMWYKSNGSGLEALYEYNMGGGDIILLRFVTNTFLRFHHAVDFQGTDATDVTVDNIATDTDWHFITFTWDVSSDLVTYNYDGTYGTSSETLETGTFSSANSVLGSTVALINRFKGQIDSVRIYNRALFADEIRMLYNQKKPVMELKFDKGSGTTAYDESFNNNDITFPATDENKPEWAAP